MSLPNHIVRADRLRSGEPFEIHENHCVINGDVPKGAIIHFTGKSLKVNGHVQPDAIFYASQEGSSLTLGSVGNDVTIHSSGTVSLGSSGHHTQIQASGAVEFDSLGDHARVTAGSISCRTADSATATEGTEESPPFSPARPKIGDDSVLKATEGDIHVFDGGSHLTLDAKHHLHFTHFGVQCRCSAGERITYQRTAGSAMLQAPLVTGSYPGPGTSIFSDDHPYGLNLSDKGFWPTGEQGAKPHGLGILRYAATPSCVSYLIPGDTYAHYDQTMKGLFPLLTRQGVLEGFNANPAFHCLSAPPDSPAIAALLDQSIKAFVKNPTRDPVMYALVSQPMLEGKITPLQDRDGHSIPMFPN